MKHFLLSALMCCCIFISKAQDPELLNKFRWVFIPSLSYGKDKPDIYGIRQTLVEKLAASEVPLLLDEQLIPRTAVKSPCSMIRCHIHNSSSPDERKTSLISVVFLNCSDDTLLIYSASAGLFRTLSDTRNSFILATKKMLEDFNNYHYQFIDSVILPAAGPAADSDSIQWTPEKKLTWEDFKGQPVNDDPADALTYTANETHFEGFGIGDRFEVESDITCFFVKIKSWVKTGMKSDYLLNHEQRHFDIAEVGAREFRKKLKLIKFTSANFNEQVKKINEEMNEKYHALQQEYDRETDHSRLEEKQVEWNKKIDAMLKESGASR